VLSQGLDLRRRDTAHELARHLGFQHAPDLEHLRASSTVGAATKAPRAFSMFTQAVLRQLEQRLPHQRARDAEVVGQFLFGQLGARLQAVLHDGAGERVGDDAGRGGSMGRMIAAAPKTVYTRVHNLWRASMGLSTHVLDTMHGTPGRRHGGGASTLEGRAASLVKKLRAQRRWPQPGRPAVRQRRAEAGHYRLVFDVAPYFRGRGVQLPDPPFLDRVTLDFGVADAGQHYHVPLLVSPWSYSTYAVG
jgi:5-hydroxyisourate hydrolase